MSKPRDPLKSLRVATPCQTTWERMAGDERVRHCSLCSLNVYNFAEMSGDEIRALLMRTEGRVCARLYRRADGTLLTSDCPTGLRALRQRMSRLAAAVIAALFSVSAFASGGKTCEKPRIRMHGSKVELEIERAVTPQQAVFTGVVRDNAGAPLPGVSVLLRDETTKREKTVISDANGNFTIAGLSDGLYRADVMLEGFESAVMEHLPLKQNEVTHVRVVLRINELTGTIGIVTTSVMENEPLTTTFTQDLINKLPI